MSAMPSSEKSEATWDPPSDVVAVRIWFDVPPERQVGGRIASRFAAEVAPLLAGALGQAAFDRPVAYP